MLIAAALAPLFLAVETPARAFADEPAGVERLERAGHDPVRGRLSLQAGVGLVFSPGGEKGKIGAPAPLASGDVVRFPQPSIAGAAIPPIFHVSIGESARISGALREVADRSLTLRVPWQDAPIQVARPGAQSVAQRPGEACVLADRFDDLNSTRWAVEGKPAIQPPARGSESRPGLRLPAAGALVRHRLAEPVAAGRLELTFLDEAKIAANSRWSLDLAFHTAQGEAVIRVVLGWAEESLAVDSPNDFALARQRLARSRGWHRLSLRFGPEHTEIAVDGKELAHGKGPPGPLQAVMLEARSTAPEAGKSLNLAGVVGEIQLSRVVESPTSLEIDPTQDEVRMVVGDQLFGAILGADADHVTIRVDGRPVVINWSEIAGLYFRRVPVLGGPIEGPLARIEWLAAPTEPNQGPDLDFAEGVITAVSESAVTVQTPYAGALTIPRDRLTRLDVHERAWQIVLDPSAHHLGDNISTTPPPLDPPQPEGGRLERSFDLAEVPARPAFLVLKIVQAVGESTGVPYSNLVRKGELRTHVALNGKRIDYLNHYIKTSNESPERIRVPLPAELLKPGKNTVLIEQSGIANDPTWFDDLGVLEISVQFTAAAAAAESSPRPAANP